MERMDLSRLLAENSYPGRGIVIGKSADGKKAAEAPPLRQLTTAAPGLLANRREPQKKSLSMKLSNCPEAEA